MVDQTLMVLNHLECMAKEAGLKLEQVATVLRLDRQKQSAQQAERRASDDDKDAITKSIEALDGALHPDILVSDILSRAGVRKSQGTSSFAKREIKRALLAHNNPK